MKNSEERTLMQQNVLPTKYLNWEKLEKQSYFILNEKTIIASLKMENIHISIDRPQHADSCISFTGEDYS